MKLIETEWALVNKKTGNLYRFSDGNKSVMTFISREEARDEKSSLCFLMTNYRDYRVERVKVTYERIS